MNAGFGIRAEQKSQAGTSRQQRLAPLLVRLPALAAACLFLCPAAFAERSCLSTNMSAPQCARLCTARSITAVAMSMPDSPRTRPPQNASMAGMQNMAMPLPPAAAVLMAEASGTSPNPASAPMPMRMMMHDGWNLNFMADGFVTDTQQSGPRGGDKLYSSNVFMGSGEHAIGRGAFLLDVMLSLEPATITGREYPELFQTGETAFGKPIENGQHPHNFVMAAGLHYAHPVGEQTIFEAYFAPVGDPALGPVAYPHRLSAAEIPQAPIGHHWEDSTHISYEVATIGLKYKILRVEASGFHGAEPNENRWNIGAGAIDSWAARLSILPAANWIAQVSVGRLAHPEALQPGDVVRTTASLEYSRALGSSAWSTSFIFGRNHETATGGGTNAFLAESVVPFRQKNFFTGRWELVDKDELFAAEPLIAQQLMNTAGTDTFRIGAYTLGYTRDFPLWKPLETGLGMNVSTYTLPAAIVPFYGAHPFGVNVYLHFQLKPSRPLGQR